MRKLTYTTESNRYFIGESTSGSTNDIYITDGNVTLKLEDCLIWDSEDFTLADFDNTFARCEVDTEEMREMGWTIVA